MEKNELKGFAAKVQQPGAPGLRRKPTKRLIEV